MAKKIQVSTDGITYVSLPTPDGSLSVTANSTDDSLLGQTFASTFPTLLDWEGSSTGLVKGYAAYCGKILKSGISTVSVAEPLSLLSGATYKTDLASHGIWDYEVTPVIFDDGLDVTNEVKTFDYLFGSVTFKATYTVVGSITADINYLPTAAFGRALSFSLTQSTTAVDDSDYEAVCLNGGYRINKQGLRDVSLSFDGIYDAAEDFHAQLESREAFIVEIDPIGDGKSIARGYFRVSDTSQDGAVGDNESESTSFSLSVPSPDFKPFGWQHASDTTLNAAIRIVLDGFDLEQDVFFKYLPDGLVGKSGSTVITDVTLESALDDLNRFSLGFTGDGVLADSSI
jgi:hypothetical protein